MANNRRGRQPLPLEETDPLVEEIAAKAGSAREKAAESPEKAVAMPECAKRTAMADILGADLSGLNSDALYRQMDRLYPMRGGIERALAERERNLFNLDGTWFLGIMPLTPGYKCDRF